MKNVTCIGVFVGCVLACLLSTTANAQVDQGRIVGVVRDPSQALITGASIAVTNERTGEKRISSTDAQGYYAFLALKPSFYTVQVSSVGFGSQEATGVALQVGQEIRQSSSRRKGERCPRGRGTGMIQTRRFAVASTSRCSTTRLADGRGDGSCRTRQPILLSSITRQARLRACRESM
jgi:hypothetical protein